MPAQIAHQSYGKSRVRLTKVTRGGGRHELAELAVDIVLEGPFEPSYRSGDNRLVVPTDTMKNTVYALAAGHPLDAIEAFALALAGHFLDRHAHVAAATIAIDQASWRRIEDDEGVASPAAFIAGGTARRTCRVRRERRGTVGGSTDVVEGGIAGLSLVKTTDSAFRGFVRDEYTTLPDTDDRIFGTTVDARWRYRIAEPVAWNAAHRAASRALVGTFAVHRSQAVQQTLLAMAEAALGAVDAIEEISIEMPNQHRVPVDLAPFGLEDRNEIFVATSEPYGLIRGTIRREG